VGLLAILDGGGETEKFVLKAEKIAECQEF
jgi:hypothetical protein